MEEDPLASLMETMHLHFRSPISQHRQQLRRRSRSSKSSAQSLTERDVMAILSSMTEDQREHHFKNFRPSYLMFRTIVAEWILDLGDYFGLHTTTSHAAISYLDRIQPNEKFCTFQWQMVAICCITIAAKYNEMEEDVPDLHSLGGIIDQDIPYNVALDYELWVLKQMGWKLNARTPLAFVSCYSCVGVLFPGDLSSDDLGEFREVNAMINKHASILANLCILNIKFKPYPSSLVAAAILFLSRKNVLGSADPWRRELTELTRSDPVSFLHIVNELEAAASDLFKKVLPNEQISAEKEAKMFIEVTSSLGVSTPMNSKIKTMPLDQQTPSTVACSFDEMLSR